MSDKVISKKAKWYMILLAIFMPLFLVVPTAYYIIKGNSDSGKDDKRISYKEALLEPVGKLARASDAEKVDADKKVVEFSVEKTYRAVCAGCHANGVLGSPIAHNKAVWEPRINSAGFDAMVKRAIRGIGQMPAKGGASNITDEQFKEVVKFLSSE